MLALCANDNCLQIYEGCNSPNFSSWRLAHVLEEHDLLITGISWSPITNKIVTCSHDRNAFVWSYNAAEVRCRILFIGRLWYFYSHLRHTIEEDSRTCFNLRFAELRIRHSSHNRRVHADGFSMFVSGQNRCLSYYRSIDRLHSTVEGKLLILSPVDTSL